MSQAERDRLVCLKKASKKLRFFGDCAPKKWPLRGSLE